MLSVLYRRQISIRSLLSVGRRCYATLNDNNSSKKSSGRTPIVDSSADVWKIEEDHKFFTASNLDDVVFVSSQEFNRVVGDLAPIHEMHSHVEDHNIHIDDIFDTNLHAHYAGESGDISSKSIAENGLPQMTNDKLRQMKKLKKTLAPQLSVHKLRSIQTFATVHLDSSGLTWTSFRVQWSGKTSTITVTGWHYSRTGFEKIKLWKMLAEVEALVHNIPVCDIYVVENIVSGAFRNNLAGKQLYDMVHMNQCVSMISSLLASRNSVASYANDPNVLFIGRDVMGRFYNLFIGNETVSTQNVVNRMIFNKHIPDESKENKDVLFEPNVVTTFEKAPRVKREYLGRTMLIGITFFRLNIMGAK